MVLRRADGGEHGEDDLVDGRSISGLRARWASALRRESLGISP